MITNTVTQTAGAPSAAGTPCMTTSRDLCDRAGWYAGRLRSMPLPEIPHRVIEAVNRRADRRSKFGMRYAHAPDALRRLPLKVTVCVLGARLATFSKIGWFSWGSAGLQAEEPTGRSTQRAVRIGSGSGTASISTAASAKGQETLSLLGSCLDYSTCRFSHWTRFCPAARPHVKHASTTC